MSLSPFYPTPRTSSGSHEAVWRLGRRPFQGPAHEVAVGSKRAFTRVPISPDHETGEFLLSRAQTQIFGRVGRLFGQSAEGFEFVLAGTDLIEEVEQGTGHGHEEEAI